MNAIGICLRGAAAHITHTTVCMVKLQYSGDHPVFWPHRYLNLPQSLKSLQRLGLGGERGRRGHGCNPSCALRAMSGRLSGLGGSLAFRYDWRGVMGGRRVGGYRRWRTSLMVEQQNFNDAHNSPYKSTPWGPRIGCRSTPHGRRQP